VNGRFGSRAAQQRGNGNGSFIDFVRQPFVLFALLGLIFFLRVNLPPNQIRGFAYIETGGRFIDPIYDSWGMFDNVGGVMNKIIEFINALMVDYQLSQFKAKWIYRDFIILKLAWSDELQIRMLALPFSRWIYIGSDSD